MLTQNTELDILGSEDTILLEVPSVGVTLTDSGRIIKYEPGKPFSEFADGHWGELRSPILLGELWEDDARKLTPEEVKKLEQSGNLDQYDF